VFRLHLLSKLVHDRAHFFRVVDQAIFFIHANGRQGRCTSHRMTVVSQPSKTHFVLKMLCDVMPHADRAQRDVTGSQSLRHADQIGNNFPVIDGEPFSGAAETSHHFVGDHQNPIFVAELANAGEISIGWNENPVGADNGFEDEPCDSLCAFELNGLLNHGKRRFSRFPSALDAVIRIEHMHHARNARFRSPSARIPGERDAAPGCAVIGAITGHDLVASGKEAGEFDGVLSGFGAAVREEEGIDIARSTSVAIKGFA
jgi:hypothetical protein